MKIENRIITNDAEYLDYVHQELIHAIGLLDEMLLDLERGREDMSRTFSESASATSEALTRIANEVSSALAELRR